jgi:hypothetical protein
MIIHCIPTFSRPSDDCVGLRWGSRYCWFRFQVVGTCGSYTAAHINSNSTSTSNSWECSKSLKVRLSFIFLMVPLHFLPRSHLRPEDPQRKKENQHGGPLQYSIDSRQSAFIDKCGAKGGSRRSVVVEKGCGRCFTNVRILHFFLPTYHLTLSSGGMLVQPADDSEWTTITAKANPNHHNYTTTPTNCNCGMTRQDDQRQRHPKRRGTPCHPPLALQATACRVGCMRW